MHPLCAVLCDVQVMLWSDPPPPTTRQRVTDDKHNPSCILDKPLDVHAFRCLLCCVLLR
jgi:hypothetical protein